MTQGAAVPMSFVAGDYNQIEARVLAWLAGETGLLEAFAAGRDVYSEFGTEYLFRRPISRDTPQERHLAKMTVLGCGFGLGPASFHAACLRQGLQIDPQLAEQAVAAYRRAYSHIVRFWTRLRDAVEALLGITPGMLVGRLYFSPGRITLPSGRHLYYHGLQRSDGEVIFRKPGNRGTQRLWGGLLAENVTQAVARDLLGAAILRILDLIEAGRLPPVVEPVFTVHDDLVCRAPLPVVPVFSQVLRKIMEERPAWAPDLPLSVTIKSGETYGHLG